ncbi:MAG: hypothetical protein AAGA03_08630 [Planctomycetota bacterium]
MNSSVEAISDPSESTHRSGRLAILVLAIAAVALLIPLPFGHRIFSVLGDLCHAPLFAALTLGGLRLARRAGWLPHSDGRSVVASIGFAISMITFSLTMEAAQYYSGRSATLHDAIANSLGTVAGLCLFWAWEPAALLRLRAMLKLVAAALLVMAWWYPTHALWDMAMAYQRFPLLGSFESPVEFQRWYVRGCDVQCSSRHVTNGNHSMRLNVKPGDYPGVTLIHMPGDWSRLDSLQVDMTLDAAAPVNSIVIEVKVIDLVGRGSYQQAARKRWTLQPGKTKRLVMSRDEIVNGPDDRRLELEHVRYVDLLVIKPQQPFSVFVDDFRLTLRQREEAS